MEATWKREAVDFGTELTLESAALRRTGNPDLPGDRFGHRDLAGARNTRCRRNAGQAWANPNALDETLISGDPSARFLRLTECAIPKLAP